MNKIYLLKQSMHESLTNNKLKHIFTILRNFRENSLPLLQYSVKTKEYLKMKNVCQCWKSERFVRNSLKGYESEILQHNSLGRLKSDNLYSLIRQTVTSTYHVRFYCQGQDDTGYKGKDNHDGEYGDERNDDENIRQGELLLQDNLYNECVKEYCSLPDVGHRVFVLQIEVTGTLKKQNLSPGHLQLAENIALVHSIPGWKVVNSEVVKVQEPRSLKKMVRAFNYVTEKIRETPGISAVFISRNALPANQVFEAMRNWHLPIFSRSFILLQVFKAQAQSREAKLHIALAELPFVRFSMQQAYQPVKYGRSPRKCIRWPFEERQKNIQAALASLEKQRSMVRKKRSIQQIPTIAVIGYTNSGKTTLIKALTGDKDMVPRNKLFATLDVTAHGGILPNNMTVVYMDTVGFLTGLPKSLKCAFTATLEDTINADLIIHVRDVSHPDFELQKLNVIESIQRILSEDKLDSMVEVCNKVDKIKDSQKSEILGSLSSSDVFCVSAVTGEGMEHLLEVIQYRLLQNIDFLQKKVKIPQNGPHLSWLYKESTVVSTETNDDDQENVIVNVYISKAKYNQFLAYFGPKQLIKAKMTDVN